MSSALHIQVDYDHTAYTPGETISGSVRWTPSPDHQSVILRLFWYTSGKGTQDIEVIHELSWPASQGQADFAIELPLEPYSFSGQLVSLNWALEAITQPGNTSTSYPFNLTPDGQLIHLPKIEKSSSGKSRKKWFKQLQRVNR